MSKTIADLAKEAIESYKTANNTFDMFPFGARVKVITPCEDFTFFYGELGKVVKNTGTYLGICVEFDEPRVYKDGTVMKQFNFNPKSLVIIPNKQIEAEPVILSRACPANCCEDKIKEVLSARDEEWIKLIERYKTITGIQIYPADWARIKRELNNAKD